MLLTVNPIILTRQIYIGQSGIEKPECPRYCCYAQVYIRVLNPPLKEYQGLRHPGSEVSVPGCVNHVQKYKSVRHNHHGVLGNY